jgi:hypothetical protein
MVWVFDLAHVVPGREAGVWDTAGGPQGVLGLGPVYEMNGNVVALLGYCFQNKTNRLWY